MTIGTFEMKLSADTPGFVVYSAIRPLSRGTPPEAVLTIRRELLEKANGGKCPQSIEIKVWVDS